MKTTLVHIDDIKPGDTIEHNGILKTVTSTNIKRSEFMGRAIFGDNYQCGYKLVKLITFKQWDLGQKRI